MSLTFASGLRMACALAVLTGTSPAGAQSVRTRATETGLVVGAGAGALTGAALAVSLCRSPSDTGRNSTAAECIAPVLVGAVLIGAVGAVVGALMGAGIPQQRPAGLALRLWQRATGSIGMLALGFGAASILAGTDGGTSLSTQLGYYVSLGPYLAVGPELAYSRFGSGVLYAASGVDPTTIDRLAWHLGGALRISGPSLVDISPYLVGGLGLYGWRWDSASIEESLGGSVGLGAAWTTTHLPFALTLETRVHAWLDQVWDPNGRPTYLSGMAGLAWSW
jgi:hypothetical protein